MNIAVLAWGSLIASPRTLHIETAWQRGGPVLPIEFSRHSMDGRLTAVIDVDFGSDAPTRFAKSSYVNLARARENLRTREGTNIKWIGFATRQGPSEHSLPQISDWLAVSRFDAVIWTALPPNFEEKLGWDFSVENAVSYINACPPNVRECVKKYFQSVPAEVRTPIRDRTPW